MKRKILLSLGVLAVFVFTAMLVGFVTQKNVTVSFNDGSDPIRTTVWTGTVADALANADADIEYLQTHYRANVDWDQPIVQNTQVKMERVFEVTLVDAGERDVIQTGSFTVDALFQEQGLNLDPLDQVNVALDESLRDDMKIVIDRIHQKVTQKEDTIPFDTVKQKDANLKKGKEVLARKGEAGNVVTKITHTYKNGKVIDTEEEVIDKDDPVNRLVKIGTKEPKIHKKSDVQLASRSKKASSSSKQKKSKPAKQTPSDSVWDQLAQCEAGGNWSINTGNGYYGGLQFSLSAWRSVGGSGYPHEHSRETQIAMGKKLQARQGWGAWPTCSKNLGLR